MYAESTKGSLLPRTTSKLPNVPTPDPGSGPLKALEQIMQELLPHAAGYALLPADKRDPAVSSDNSGADYLLNQIYQGGSTAVEERLSEYIKRKKYDMLKAIMVGLVKRAGAVEVAVKMAREEF